MALLDDYRTEEQLAAELKEKTGNGCVRTLRKWRERRVGPPWTTIGRTVVYPIDQFESWLKARVQQPARSRRAA